jgi:hypothetical protein
MSALLLPLTWKCRALMELSRPGVLRIVRRAQQVLLAILQGVSSTSAETANIRRLGIRIVIAVLPALLVLIKLSLCSTNVKRVRIV